MSKNKMQLLMMLPALTLTLISCADWQTTPTTVDEHHGLAFKEMVKNQTLYPEHGLEKRQDLILDGRKAEGIYTPYQAPATDLRQGKESRELDMDSSGN